MAQANTMTKMHLAVIIEDYDNGFHRESLWFGATPGNLGLMIIDTMKDWYDDEKESLDKSIVKYHKMLEDKDSLTFSKLAGQAFNANGKKIVVQVSNDLNDMFNFIVNEICNIFAENGETAATFKSLAEFRFHFKTTYNLDEELAQVLESVNEATISRALYILDMKYDFTGRHTVNPLN